MKLERWFLKGKGFSSSCLKSDREASRKHDLSPLELTGVHVRRPQRSTASPTAGRADGDVSQRVTLVRERCALSASDAEPPTEEEAASRHLTAPQRAPPTPFLPLYLPSLSSPHPE